MNTRGARHQSLLKRLELSIRDRWNRGRYGHGSPQLVKTPTDILSQWPSGVGLRILLLRQDRIGDVLVATPVIREIRRRYPKATIDMVLSTNNQSVRTAVAPYINTIHVLKKSVLSVWSLWWTLRRARYTAVVDLLDNASTTSGMLIEASAAVFRFGIDKDNRGVYSHVVPLLSQSTVLINLRVAQLLLLFGINPESVDLRPEYPVTTAELQQARQRLGLERGLEHGQRTLGVVLSGSLAFKRYSIEKFAIILNRLRSEKPWLRVYVFGGPAEQQDVQRLAAETGSYAVGPSAFHQYAVDLRVMDVLLVPDTAAVHLAAAAGTHGTPCVVLYVPDVHGRLPWYPWRTPHEAVMSPTDHLNDINPNTVVEAVHRLFAYCSLDPDTSTDTHS